MFEHNSQTIAGLAPVAPPRVPITPEVLKTLVNKVMIEFAPMAAQAAAGHFACYSFLTGEIIRKAVNDHNVDARTLTAGEVASELYPALVLPGLHLNQPEEDRVRQALLEAVSFGSALGMSMHMNGKMAAQRKPATDQEVSGSAAQIASWQSIK